MNTNVGTLDRALRIIIGTGLVLLAATEIVGPWGWIGIVPLVTALIGWCPAYTLLGIRTCHTASDFPADRTSHLGDQTH